MELKLPVELVVRRESHPWHVLLGDLTMAAVRQDVKVPHVQERPVLFIFFCIIGQNRAACLHRRFAGLSSVCVRRCIYLYRSQPSLAACFSSVLDAVAGLISGVKRGNKAVLHSLFMTSSMCQILVPVCLRILQCTQRVTRSRRLVRIFGCRLRWSLL